MRLILVYFSNIRRLIISYFNYLLDAYAFSYSYTYIYTNLFVSRVLQTVQSALFERNYKTI